jgi:homoserine kinase
MRRIKVTLPATITNFGPGLHSLGLAVALHTTVEITERADTALNVETSGEDAGRFALGIRHPVVLGMSRIFQRLEKTTPGMNVRIENRIPASVGLGVETSFLVAGMIAANNLFGSPFTRAELLNSAAAITGRADQTVTCMLGGLTSTVMLDDAVLYRSLSIQPLKLVLVLPNLADYAERSRSAVPERAPMPDALFNLSRLPIFIDALRAGDLKLAGQVMHDRLFTPYRAALIPGFDDIAQTARLNGAHAVTLCGSGATLLALAHKDHERIASVMVAGFEDIGIAAKAWVLPVDTQGVVLSVAQTS